MSVLTPTEPLAAAVPPAPLPPLYRLSVQQYQARAREGILASGAPVELIEGLLVSKMTIHPPHDYATQTLRELLVAMAPAGWFVNSQSPLTTPDSAPEPDVSMVRGQRRAYAAAGRHPSPEDLGLVVEVADSSLAVDRGAKRRVYARANAACYWIVNLVDRRIEVYTDPSGPGDDPAYRQQHDYPAGTEVPVLLDGREVGRVRVNDLLL